MIPDPITGEASSVESLGGESREGFKSTDFQSRLQRYGIARENAYRFVPYLRSQQQGKLANKLAGCGNYAVFREYFTIQQTRLSGICTCKVHLLCPLCAIRRGAKALKVYISKVQFLLESDPQLRPYLVTFTVKNGPDLEERQKHLASSIRHLHKLRHLNRGHEVCKASSAVWSYELTNKGKGWHPHVHAIWLCREKPDMHKLRDEWFAITGDSFMVDVTPVDMTDPIGGFLEVFKYALKFSDLDDSSRLHAYQTLKGKRLQDSFGDLRGLDVEPSDSDDLLEDLPYIQRIYQFVPGLGYLPEVRNASFEGQTIPAL